MTEPQHIKEILPEVMKNIEARMKRHRRNRIIDAVGDFLKGKNVADKQRKIQQKVQNRNVPGQRTDN